MIVRKDGGRICANYGDKRNAGWNKSLMTGELPQDVVDRMVQEIPHARYVDIPGTNHYSIVFEQIGTRDRSILEFLGR